MDPTHLLENLRFVYSELNMMESFEYLYLWANNFFKNHISLLEDTSKTTHPHHTSLNHSTIEDWIWRWQRFFFLQFSTSSTHFFTAKILHTESIIVKHNQYGKTNNEIKNIVQFRWNNF